MNATLIVLGIVAVVIGGFASMYTETQVQNHLWGLYQTTSTSSPYSGLAVPLVIGGIVLIMVGVASKK